MKGRIPMIFKRTELRTTDGLVIYDNADPSYQTLLAGVDLPLDEIEIRGELPEGFKFISVEDIEQFFNI